MWIARDKNKQLFVFTEKPVRDEYYSTFYGDECLELNKDEFPEITWENSPIKIETISNKIISTSLEQRIYEIAKGSLELLLSNPATKEVFASYSRDAVKYADALIKELKK